MNAAFKNEKQRNIPPEKAKKKEKIPDIFFEDENKKIAKQQDFADENAPIFSENLDREIPEETPYRDLKRTGKVVAAHVGGYPGSIAQSATSMIDNAYENAYGAPPEKDNILLNLAKATVPFSELPTTQDINKFIESKDKNLVPQTPGEKQYEDVLGTAIDLSAPSGEGKIQFIRAMLGAVLGEGADQISKNQGVSEGWQKFWKTLGNAVPFLIKGKPLPSNKESQELYKAALAQGFTDKELTPLFQDPEKLKHLSKVAAKTSKVAQTTQQTQDRFSSIFDDLVTRGENLGPISQSDKKNIIHSFENTLRKLQKSKLPTEDTQKAIKTLEESIAKMKQKGINAGELIATYRDVNKWEKIAFGQQPAAEIRNVIKSTLHKLDEPLAKDFALTNNLYSKFKTFEKAFTPSEIEKVSNAIFKYGKWGTLLTGIATGNYPIILGSIAAPVGRRIATKLLTDPSWQNIHKNVFNALRSNSPVLVPKAIQQIKNKLRKDDKDLYDQIDWDALDDSIPKKQKAKQ